LNGTAKMAAVQLQAGRAEALPLQTAPPGMPALQSGVEPPHSKLSEGIERAIL
jgi:hypothetical protein